MLHAKSPDKSCADDAGIASASYPLWRRYCLIVLPMLALAILCILLAVSNALTLSVERAYRAQAGVLHRSLAHSISATGQSWRELLSGSGGSASSKRVTDALQKEAMERGLYCVAILRIDGTMLASTQGAGCMPFKHTDIGTLTTSTNIFMEQEGPPLLWTVATLLNNPNGPAPFIISTSEHAAARERLVEYDILFWLAALGIPLIGAVALSTVLVFKAQGEIDRRTIEMTNARAALGRFLSDSTQKRIRDRTPAARRLEATVMFIDIRNFSSFAESSTAEEAVALVSQVANIAFTAIIENNGDVDRLLGDGVIAWFEGDDRNANAWVASERILSELRAARLPREVGIGLHDGKILEAEIGIADRKDATILGATVNIAARLCGLAAGNEIMASVSVTGPEDDTQLRIADNTEIALKGHRWTIISKRAVFKR